MRIYTVHYLPVSIGPDRNTVLVKEGFCWPALLFTALWALWHRLWLAAALIVAANFALELLLTLTGADPVSRAAATLGLSAFIGYGANDWLRAKLARLGYLDAGVVVARNAEAGALRFFDLHPEFGDPRPMPMV